MKRRLRLFAILGLGIFGSLSSCSHKKSTSSDETRLGVYIGVLDYSTYYKTSRIYVLDADSLIRRDSIPLSAPSMDLEVSADGKALFVLLSEGPGYDRMLQRISTRSKSPEWTWVDTNHSSFYAKHVVPLNSGKWLLFGRSLLKSIDGTAVSRLPDSILPYSGPLAGSEVAALVPVTNVYSDSVLRILDAKSLAIRGRYVPRLHSGTRVMVNSATRHPDGHRVLVLGRALPGGQGVFVIGDMETGETLFQLPLVYPLGEIGISPDGQYAVVTDPSQTLRYDSWSTLDIIDLQQLEVVKHFVWDHAPMYWPCQIAFLPGGDQFITAPPGDLSSFGPLIQFDLPSRSIDRVVPLDPVHDFGTGGLGVGPMP